MSICLSTIYIPSIFFYLKNLQDSTGYCFPISAKRQFGSYQFILMLEAFKEIWLMKNDTITLLAHLCIRNK